MKTNRRLLASLLCFLMIVFGAVGLTSCDEDDTCSHQWGEWTATTNATCTEAGVKERKCSACGETETSAIEALGHDWSEATCSAPKTCKNCSATEGAALAHAYTVETVKAEALKSAATEESAAIYYKSCACGAISTSDEDTFTHGDPLAHTHSFVVETAKAETLRAAATCNGAAVYYKSCACGAISTSDEETFTSGDPLAHTDANKDHACDNGCSKTFGEHTDGEDADHLCDYGCSKTADSGCYDTVVDGKCDECGEKIEHPCADQDKNHTCDVCSEEMGEHADANKDHNCDYGCSDAIGTCTDADKDHACDYGCSKVHGTCEDADKDHDCDYGCDKTFGTCEDADKDHDCDYGCDKTFGEHTDGDDNNHLCDYGCELIADDGCHETDVNGKCDECGADIPHPCSDDNKNHACDICGAMMGDHVDANKDHKCDYGCNNQIGNCTDADKDHKCDHGCSKTFGTCEDAIKDHKCDYGCKKTFGTCGDGDKDHHCDYGCPETFGACVDENKDHKCDHGCSKIHGTCEDVGKDHKCDYGCDKFIGTCVDENKDHHCDYGCTKLHGTHADAADDGDHVCDYGCEAVLEPCSDKKDDGNHSCDVCGNADVSDCDYSDATCGAPATCSECGATSGSTLDHVDGNRDHSCDNNCQKNDLGIHADAADDGDHVCDYGCGAVLEDCSDVNTDKDHACDVCNKADVSAHVYVEDVSLATEATCTAAATKTYKCNCGHTYTEDDGDALDHDISGVKATERKVSEDDNDCEYVLVYKCQRKDCGKEVLGETVYKHKYVASIGTPATCSTEGQKVFKCSICGDTGKKPEAIPADATGHDWESGEVVDGVRTDHCSLCSETKTVIVSESNTASSNASNLADADLQLKVDENTNANIQLGQGVADAIGDKDITISAGVVDETTLKGMGVSEDQLKQIGANTVYDFNIKDENGTSVSDFGKENFVTITLPYVLSEGEDVDSIAVWFISDTCQDETCDKGEDCVDAHKLVSIEATYNNGFVTFRTNHFSIYTVTRLTPAERCALYGHGYVCQHVEGSCTKDEYDLYVCVRCHDKYIDKTEGKYIVADGHDYKSETHGATCTTSGYVLYTCADCGHSYRTKLNASGHAWSVKETVPATCASDGYTKYGCANCDGEYTVAHSKLSHSYTHTAVPATCTADGYTVHACGKCGYSYTDTYLSALGHAYESVNWTWAADDTSATLTFVCKNDASHVMVLNATVTTDVVSGTCSNFVKTTYTATVSFGGTDYVDERVIEIGTPDHVFSSNWKTDDVGHWHECACGEKSEVIAHVFENATTTKHPTCAEAGESTAYCVCGKTKVSVLPATGDHNYEDGFCTVCGAEFVDAYYLNLVNSWKTVEGFSVRIQDLSYEVKRQDSTLIDELRLLGRIQQINVAELALYLENGELCGAATGSISIFNRPFANANAVYGFKAVIHEGYVYIKVEYGKETADKTLNVKVSVDSILESMLEEMEIEGEVEYVLDFFQETVLPLIDTLVEMNSEDVNAVLEDAFNMIFTFLEQEDGSYVATLDYAKLRALNENLATKSIAQTLDIYFGEGAFDSIAAWVLEILDLEVSEIPAYLDEHGIDSATLIARINALALQMGAPQDFDIGEFFENEDLAGMTVGMIAFDTEKDAYTKKFNEVVSLLREQSLYQLINPKSADAIKEGVAGIIDLIADCASLSFATNRSGTLLSMNVSVDGFTYTDDRDTVYVNFSLDIAINGRIDVTWTDIIEEIESGITLPSEEMLGGGGHSEYDYGWGGYVTYNGKEYKYSNGIQISVYETNYDQPTCVIFGADCTGWTRYQAFYEETVSWFMLVQISVDGEPVMLLINDATDEVVELVQTETGFTAIFADGTEKDIAIDFSAKVESIAQVYTDLCLAVFENPEGTKYPFGDPLTYFYNAEREEYALKSHHAYEYEYIVEGDSCEDGCITRITCKNCDYLEEQTSYWCDIEYDVEFDLSEHSSCGGYLRVDRCRICGHISAVNDMRIECNTENAVKEEILDDLGNVVGYQYTATCPDCGLTFVSGNRVIPETACTTHEYRELYIYAGEDCIFEWTYDCINESHEIEVTYELQGETCEDGYWVIERCERCGETRRGTSGGHRYQHFESDWADLGGCSGTVEGQSCYICGEIVTVKIWDVDCELGEGTVEETVDKDGVVHRVTTQICPDCGLKYVTESWTMHKNACVSTENTVVTVFSGEKKILSSRNSYTNEKHQYEYTYDMDGETCEDGYYVNQHCDVCGEDYTYRDWGHQGEFEKIDLREYGLCGGYAEHGYCRVCSEVLSSYVDERCCWEYVGDNSDGYTTYECCDCGAIKLFATKDSEKDENCCYVHTETTVYIVNGEEVYRYERSYTKEDHRFCYEFALNGTSCADGYTVFITCENCDFYDEEESTYHNNYLLFRLEEDLACCDEHHFEVYGCPCGEYYNVDFNSYTFAYDEDRQMYVCDNCDLTVVYGTDTAKEGCLIVETSTVAVALSGEELYRNEKERVQANHSFIDVETAKADGATCFSALCDVCGATNSTELLSVDMGLHEKEYYCDYTLTPDETAVYTITGLSNRDTYVTLYRMVLGQLEYVGSNDDGAPNAQFSLTKTLTAGETYVYRIGFYGYDEEGTINFALGQGAEKDTVCHHDRQTDFSVLLDGSETCEDGVLCGGICTSCGCVNYVTFENEHRTALKERGDLSEHGACCGEYVVYSCACGQDQSVDTYGDCAYRWTNNQYYDEEVGEMVYVTARTCPDCGLRYTTSYYTVRDRESCTATYYYTVVINVGTELVFETEYTKVEEVHEYVVYGVLKNGAGSSCEDGVTITRRCKDCGREECEEVSYHKTFVKENIDLSELECVCGGTAALYECACGYEGHVSLDHTLCEWGTEWCEFWIEDVITEGQETINGWNGYGYNSYVYICAVTDPEDAACAYKIRYAYYWLKDENSCMAYRYETWQFGYDEETDTCLHEVTFKTGEGRICHDYVDSSTENHTRYDCSDCGSYYYEDWYYDEDDNLIKYEREVSNALDDGNDRYYQRVEEYALNPDNDRYCCREYEKRIYSDGEETWWERLNSEQAYTGPFGDSGRKVSCSYSDSDGYSYSEGSAYVLWNGYEYQICSYRTEGDYWYRYDYSYSFEDGCFRTEYYTNSDGESYEETDDICRFWSSETISEPTCSQDGKGCNTCVVCGKRGEPYTLYATDHNWVQLDENWHYCFACGLENANGVSGDIIMEDLTEVYGNGEYYVVGYAIRNDVEFTQYVSLILADGTEVAIWSGIEFVTIDGIRGFAFSKAAVEAWATENGYSDYDVRFSFVPVGSDGSFDYGITFTEPVEIDTIVDKVSFSDYIGEGETNVYTVTPAEDGLWTFTSASENDTCGYLYDAEGNEIAYDDDGGYNANFKIVYELKAGETYTVRVRWYSSDCSGTMALLFDWKPVVAE